LSHVLTFIVTDGTREAAKSINSHLKKHDSRVPYRRGYLGIISITPTDTLSDLYLIDGFLEAYIGPISTQNLEEICERGGISDIGVKRQLLEAMETYNALLQNNHPYMKLKEPLPINVSG
jgi:hypothetical protein